MSPVHPPSPDTAPSMSPGAPHSLISGDPGGGGGECFRASEGGSGRADSWLAPPTTGRTRLCAAKPRPTPHLLFPPPPQRMAPTSGGADGPGRGHRRNTALRKCYVKIPSLSCFGHPEVICPSPWHASGGVGGAGSHLGWGRQGEVIGVWRGVWFHYKIFSGGP